MGGRRESAGAGAKLSAAKAFVVVQDLFLTETAERADVVFPASCAYEKSGTVTNTCGEVQRLKKAVQYMGAKPDLEIIGLIAKEMEQAATGSGSPTRSSPRFRRRSTDTTCRSECWATAAPHRACPSTGASPSPSGPSWRGLEHDTLFTSGTLGRYSSLKLRVGTPEPRLMNFFLLSLIGRGAGRCLIDDLAYLQWVERKVYDTSRCGWAFASARTGCSSRWPT